MFDRIFFFLSFESFFVFVFSIFPYDIADILFYRWSLKSNNCKVYICVDDSLSIAYT